MTGCCYGKAKNPLVMFQLKSYVKHSSIMVATNPGPDFLKVDFLAQSKLYLNKYKKCQKKNHRKGVKTLKEEKIMETW